MKGRPLITVCFLSEATFHFAGAANTSTKWTHDRLKSIIKQIVKGCTVGLDEPHSTLLENSWRKQTRTSLQLYIKACSSSCVLRKVCGCFIKSSDAPFSPAGTENRWGKNPELNLESRSRDHLATPYQHSIITYFRATNSIYLIKCNNLFF